MYDDTVSTQRRGELIRKSSDECLQFSKRVYEIVLAAPLCPLSRLTDLLDRATQSSPAEMDADDGQFASKTCAHISVLLKEARRVSMYAQHRIGTLLDRIHSRNPGHQLTDVQISLCNYVSEQKAAYYRRIRDECSGSGCRVCSAAKDSDDGPESHRTIACDLTQRTCRLKDADFDNFTTTFLDHCREVAALPLQSPLVWGSDLQGQARELVERAEDLGATVVSRGLPRLTTGLVPVFSLKEGESAVEALQYSDGDGGFIVCELFPGLQEYLEGRGIPLPDSVRLAEHRYSLMPFREEHHDAIELGHVYTIVRDELDEESPTGVREGVAERNEWGYEALVVARGNLARAVRLFVVPNAETVYTADGRLFVEVFSQEAGERLPKATGVRLIERGLSYPTDRALPAYQQAWDRSTQGLHHYGGLSTQAALCPWELKSAFRRDGPDSSVEAEWETESGAVVSSCKVTNSTDRLNEANVFVLKSTIEGAGLGLFLRPTPLFGVTPLTIPPDRAITVYSRMPTTADVNGMESTDYLLEFESGRRGRTVRFNPEVFTGAEMGRFINQGGLLEGVRAMCRACDRVSGSTGFSPADVDRAILPHCNVTYKLVRLSTVNVVSRNRIQSTSQPRELFSHYGISYWLRYVARNLPTIGHETELERCVLWTLLSQNSSYGGHDVDIRGIPTSFVEKYKQMPCPQPQLPRRGRRHLV